MAETDLAKFGFVQMRIPSSLFGALVIIAVGIIFAVAAQFLLEPIITVTPLLFAAGLIATTVLSAIFAKILIPRTKLHWSLFTSLLNQILFAVIIIAFLVSTRITLADSVAIWTVLAFTLWMITFIGVVGMELGAKSIATSLLQPSLVWLLSLYCFAFGHADLVVPFLVMVVGLVATLGILLFSEHLFSLVFYGMSGFKELSRFLKGVRGEQASLGIGRHIDALLQYIVFRQGARERVLVAPWLHSGPLRGVGGGNLSTNCIKRLNHQFADSFILHVPSSHELNPSSDVSHEVLHAIETGKLKFSKLEATPLRTLEKDGIKVYGQRLNDLSILTFSSPLIDDYDINVFVKLREKYKDRNILFVDAHPNVPMVECINVEPFTKEAQTIEWLVDAMLAQLDREPMYPAKIGTALGSADGYSVFAFVLEVASSKFLYLIFDTNGLTPHEKRRIRKDAEDMGITASVLLTTDTHALSIKSLISRKDLPFDVIASLIKAAMTTADAEFAYSEQHIRNVRVLGKSYYDLLTVTRLLTRVIPLVYGLFFILMIVLLWIF